MVDKSLREILFVGIEPKLNQEYRNLIGKTKGCNRGALKEATEEAIRLWIDKQEGN